MYKLLQRKENNMTKEEQKEEIREENKKISELINKLFKETKEKENKND